MKVNNADKVNIVNPLAGANVNNGLLGNRKTLINISGSKMSKSGEMSPLEEKTQAARKKAMKLVSDAFAGEREADKMMDEQRERFKELQMEVSNLKSQIKDMEERVLPNEASDADREAYSQAIFEYKRQAEAALQEMHAINQTLTSTKIERLKTNPVGNAFDEGDKVMDAAVDAAIGEMTTDAIGHIEEDLEEKLEQAKEAKEKKEELEERIEKSKEKKEDHEDLTEEILEEASSASASKITVTEAQDQVKQMLNKLGLIEEEIKGAAVDELK